MKGYAVTLDTFNKTSTHEIVLQLKTIYPMAQESQIQSWQTLIDDVKRTPELNRLPSETVIAIEYSLPTEGMAIDLMLAGLDNNNQRIVFIVESKQWNDIYINQLSFSAYREDGKELHPKVQVSRHKLSFCDYLDVGQSYEVYPYVFIRNCSQWGIARIEEENPRPTQTQNITVTNRISDVIIKVAETITGTIIDGVEELLEAEYCPSKDIVRAMNSIVSKEEPFILTEEQHETVKKVKEAIASGKKIIRITGAAGSGKTAILLNLYVEYLNEIGTTTRPIFISGAQNTAYYRSVYPEVEGSFNYSFSLDRMVAKTKGNLYVIMMDEAQHNQQGIITNMVTPREAARLQSFPDTFICNPNDHQAYKQFGNAVNVKVIQYMAEQLFKNKPLDWLETGTAVAQDAEQGTKTENSPLITTVTTTEQLVPSEERKHPLYEKSLTSTVYVIHEDKVPLHMHKKFNTWFPVGGHLEPNELPQSGR